VLSYGVVVRWPPAVAHSAIGVRRILRQLGKEPPKSGHRRRCDARGIDVNANVGPRKVRVAAADAQLKLVTMTSSSPQATIFPCSAVLPVLTRFTHFQSLSRLRLNPKTPLLR
jgi:hypothetical protein